ncbi:unnamed protein product [Effrenium voratum]|nr:unnamed protein product [Effrenium voratum]
MRLCRLLRAASGTSASAARSSPAAAWQLVEDLRLAVAIDRESGHGTERRAKTVSEAQLQNFSARARAALGADFEANVAIFFWLAKAAYGGNVDEDLLLRYTRYVRRQGLASSEEQLVKVLRSLIGALNRNKMQRALDAGRRSSPGFVSGTVTCSSCSSRSSCPPTPPRGAWSTAPSSRPWRRRSADGSRPRTRT